MKSKKHSEFTSRKHLHTILTVKAMNGALYLMLGKAVQRIARLKYLIQSITAVVLTNKLSSQCYILTNVLMFMYQFGVVF